MTETEAVAVVARVVLLFRPAVVDEEFQPVPVKFHLSSDVSLACLIVSTT